MNPVTPNHVPEALVFEFNIYSDKLLNSDIHNALTTLHRVAPDVFWTNANTGHWIVTRFDLQDEILKDYERFSSAGNHPPQMAETRMIPLNLDPPEHTYFRAILMRHFGPPAIKKLEPQVEHWARTLVERVADRGQCEFMADIGSLFPVSIFMELMGLPLERLREYRALVVEYFDDIAPERFMELQHEITRQMREVLDARAIEPRDDLATKLQNEEVDGRRMTMPELEALTNLLFQAGMDTVANFAGFFFRYLGARPELQRQIRENPDKIPDFVEEGFRMFGVANSSRKVRHDLTFAGVQMRAGDKVMCMLGLGGMDERKNPDPHAFKFDRAQRDHMLFSKGVHLCIGHTLAKAEMRALLKEWFARIPEFRIPDNYEPVIRAGSVMGISHLPLEWTPAKAQSQV